MAKRYNEEETAIIRSFLKDPRVSKRGTPRKALQVELSKLFPGRGLPSIANKFMNEWLKDHNATKAS